MGARDGVGGGVRDRRREKGGDGGKVGDQERTGFGNSEARGIGVQRRVKNAVWEEWRGSGSRRSAGCGWVRKRLGRQGLEVWEESAQKMCPEESLFFIELCLTFNILLVSGVPHSDSIFLCVKKVIPRRSLVAVVTMQSYYSIIDCILFPVLFTSHD